jgi:cell division septation protein DedD
MVSAAVNDNVLKGLYQIDASDFAAGNSEIEDGGDDMYDDGNIFQPGLTYTDGCAMGSADDGSEYIMDIVNGGISVTYFPSAPSQLEISGETGADGDGIMETGSYSYGGWNAYWKQILETRGDPGINQLWITNSTTANQSVPDTDTDNDNHVLDGVGGAEVFYLHWGKVDVVGVSCYDAAWDWDQGILAFCPANCTLDYGLVRGSGPYTRDSAICPAAIHAGLLTNAGGLARVKFVTYDGNYTNSSGNGITTGQYTGWEYYYEDAFVFSPDDTPDCVDSDAGATFMFDDSSYDCAEYARDPDLCYYSQYYDDGDFTASDMCCVCKQFGYTTASEFQSVVRAFVSGLSGPETTVAPETTEASSTAAPETTGASSTSAPETTEPSSTAAPESTEARSTASPETIRASSTAAPESTGGQQPELEDSSGGRHLLAASVLAAVLGACTDIH